MDAALAASAALMGLAGTPHCAAMCGAACTALTGGRAGGRSSLWAFHGARVAGYAAAGALAAASVGTLGLLGNWSPALRPLWTLVHAAAIALGVWLLVTGRQPAWFERLGRHARPSKGAGGWQRLQGPGPARAGAAGALWFAWPCGLLQSALLVASLANTPAGGAAAMAAFGIASASGLLVGPWLWLRLGLGRTTAAGQATWAVRSAGALLAGVSLWAVGHGVWARVLDYCFG